jgi:cyclophilin family peptidyl-prolyl cis-trans isomerase
VKLTPPLADILIWMGQYTIFGECISGFETIDKIAALKTDENNRPFTDVKITVTVLDN